jgi:hypothetical protein
MTRGPFRVATRTAKETGKMQDNSMSELVFAAEWKNARITRGLNNQVSGPTAGTVWLYFFQGGSWSTYDSANDRPAPTE